ncbi:M17 family peptidase N-terminal domain-containing protein [Rubrivirga sp. S365]|uniref:leucyl aminopeptidase family protein n=1 Tax=Rubrivirga sp. S365 TaxID=3076080 RepID=UPI0028C51212|nr:M17 family peptidase N-terminal domain-containing protein [Rubrivirga sp. S365]MDT7857443.1 M17 family peptidase N-terminal domain-containing protein [Rubrivirga sp. S365]
MTDLVSGPLADLSCDLLVLPVDEGGAAAWADAFGGAFETALADARTAKGAAVLIPGGSGPRRVAVVDARTPDGLERWRWAAAEGARASARVEAERVVVATPPGAGADVSAALVEGFRLGAYRFDHYRTATAPPAASLALWSEGGVDDLGGAVERADVRADVTNRARDYVNLAPDEKMPADLADLVAADAEAVGLRVEVWDKARIEEEQMGGLLGVNRGSLDPPRFVVLEWAPEGHADDDPVVFVGKTVTYDTGGLSLKPTKNSMDKMKADMAGGAAVAGALLGAARLKLPLRVIGLLPMSDNRPGGRAYVPGDVLTMHSGATVEVMNTDAEGRLLLADALSYARTYAPRWVLDAATLTGAQGVALGERVAAVVTRVGEEALAERVRAAGDATGDLAWPLPLYPHYRDQLKSDVADLSNVGGAMAGTITAAAFLEHFTHADDEGGAANENGAGGADDAPAFPWVHLDLARPAFLDSAYGYRPKGGTGFGVRLLLDLLTDDAEPTA